MQRSVVVAGSLLAVLGLLGWLLWVGTTDPAPEVAAAPAAAQPDPPLERPATGLAQPGEGPETVLTATLEPQTAPDVRGRVESTPAGDVLEVVLIDPSGAPVAGAEVWVLADASSEDNRVFGLLDEVDARMRELGARRESDGAGRLDIAAPGGAPTLILASRAPLWGVARIDADDEGPIELELEHDATLRACVVDGRNRPLAGATVQLLQKHERWSSSARDRVAEGERAIATFRHAQRTVRAAKDRSWALGIDALLEEPVERAIEPGALPTDVVTLALPQTGSAEVRVFDEGWVELAGDGEASLGIIREGEPQRVSPFSDIRRPRTEQPVENGVARFPFVELGRELEIQARRGGSRIATYAFGRGPSVAGEKRTFDVRLGSDHPVARIRAVDGEGRPIANTGLHVRVRVRARHISNEDDVQVETDDQGWFKVDLANDWIEGTSRVLIVTRGQKDDPQASGEVDAGRELQPGLNDLGQVVLAEAALFVRGRVVSTAGEPMAGAKLELRTRSEERDWWNNEWSFRQQAGEDGRFEVRGTFAGDEFQLGASKEGWAGSRREFVPGEGALVLELSAEGAVAGSVLLDGEIPPDLLRLRLKSPGHGVDHWDTLNAELEPDGTFRFDGLVAGEHALTLGFEGGELMEIPGIIVRAGETTRDPRLAGIDLRGTLFVHHLTFVTADADASLQGQISFGPPDAEELAGNRWFHERELDLVTEHEALDLIVSARGYRTATLKNVRGDVEVRLEGGLRVRLRLVGDAELPQPPLFVKAVLAPADDTHNSLDWGAAPFDQSREIAVRVPAAGEMNVQWILERRSSGSSVATTADVEPEQTVEVLDLPDQIVEVSLTREQMQLILSALE